MAKRTERIYMRTTPETKAFVEYLSKYYDMDNTQVMEQALKEYYHRQYTTFRNTVEWEVEKHVTTNN